MEEKLVLKDGTEIIGGQASRLHNELMITVPGNEIVEATLTFSDPEKTEEIISYSSVYKRTYRGFTQLSSVQLDVSGESVQVWLKGNAESVEEKSEYTVPEEYLPESMRTKKQEEESNE